MEEKKLKKFDLEAAKVGAPVVTMEGYPVKIYDFEFNNETYHLFGKVMFPDGDRSGLWTNEGCYSSTKELYTRYDLFMAKMKKEGWVNIYEAYGNLSEVTASVVVYSTKEDAIECRERGSNIKYIDTVKIEWEE